MCVGRASACIHVCTMITSVLPIRAIGPRIHVRTMKKTVCSLAPPVPIWPSSQVRLVGGAWSLEAARFVRLLARCRARSVPPSSRPAAISAFAQRWSALLASAAARAFAASLLSLPLAGTGNIDGELPALSELLADSSAARTLAAAPLHRDRADRRKKTPGEKKKNVSPEHPRPHDDNVRVTRASMSARCRASMPGDADNVRVTSACDCPEHPCPHDDNVRATRTSMSAP